MFMEPGLRNPDLYKYILDFYVNLFKSLFPEVKSYFLQRVKSNYLFEILYYLILFVYLFLATWHVGS